MLLFVHSADPVDSVGSVSVLLASAPELVVGSEFH